jgi:hypothetical protein
MEKRKSERFKTGNKCRGKLIVGEKIKIKNISISGICMEILQHLRINNIYKIEIVCSKNKKITPTGVVVWSSFRGSLKKKGDILPIYQVGLKFIELNDTDKHFLDKLISEFTKRPITS